MQPNEDVKQQQQACVYVNARKDNPKTLIIITTTTLTISMKT